MILTTSSTDVQTSNCAADVAAVENHKPLEMFSLSFHVRQSTQQTGRKRGQRGTEGVGCGGRLPRQPKRRAMCQLLQQQVELKLVVPLE